MPRSLAVQRSIVPAVERTKYLERLRARKEHYERAGCKFWVFEEAALPGAFIEFMESASAPALVAAHATAPEPVLNPDRIYNELELS
jgi:hypothetical protein